MNNRTPSAQTQPKIANLQLQTSAYGNPIPIVYGTTRIPGNVIDYRDFTAIKHTTQQQGGKGGGGSIQSVNYTYTAAVMLGLCAGVCGAAAGAPQNIGVVWHDKAKITLAACGFSYFSGTLTQSPWAYMSTNHSSAALGYSGLCYVAAPTLALGSAAQLGNYSFEVYGQFVALFDGAVLDASPADIVYDLLTNTIYGAAWPTGRVGDLTPIRTYAKAQGLALSVALVDQRPLQDHLAEILTAANTAAVWSEGVLKLIPYGDVAVTGNSTTFTPNTTPVYDLGVDDFLVTTAGKDPVSVMRTAQSDTFNAFPIEILDRGQDYNVSVVEDIDGVDADAFGLRRAQPTSLHCFARPEYALKISRMLAQRSLYVRNTYTFTLGWKYILLEPMDLVTLTEPTLGLDHKVVRIKEIKEDNAGALTITAEEWPFGVASPTAYTPQAGSGTIVDYNVDPGNANTPVIFSVPTLYTAVTSGGVAVPAVAVATAGGANWGGANVWVSYDNVTFSLVGAITEPCRYGTVITATFPTNATNADTTHTLHVDLGVSGGALVSCSAQDKDDLVSLCWIQGAASPEMLAFQTATLVSGNKYDLTTFQRGVYGTKISQSIVGRNFVRFDKSVFTYALPATRFGVQLWIKLQSFNKYGGGLQDLSTLSSFTFTPNATQLNPPSPFNATISIATSAPTIAAGQRRHKVYDEDNGFGFDGSSNPVMKQTTFATVAWTFSTPLYPTSMLSGFLVVLTTSSTDPTDESNYLVPPQLVGPTVTSLVLPIPSLKATTTVYAYVAAQYVAGNVQSLYGATASPGTINPSPLAMVTTSNYTEDGSGNPTAGAKIIPGAMIPLKMGPGGAMIGKYLLDEPALRAINSIRRQTATLERYWYNGNCDTATRGGAPDISLLTITRRLWANAGLYHGRLEFKIQPNSATDNVDAMRYARVDWYAQSARGTTATLTLIDSVYYPLHDRLYKVATADNDATNALVISAHLTDPGIGAGGTNYPAVVVTLYNAFGPSDSHCFYSGSTAADGVALVDNGTSWPAGLTGGTGGGSGGGGGGGGPCPAPWVRVQLVDGRAIPAGSLAVGDLVWTQTEDGAIWDIFPVTAVSREVAEKLWELKLRDGRVLAFSEGHRLRVRGIWTPIQHVHADDEIEGELPGIVLAAYCVARNVEVIRITVAKANTYLTEGLLSHNAKPLN